MDMCDESITNTSKEPQLKVRSVTEQDMNQRTFEYKDR